MLSGPFPPTPFSLILPPPPLPLEAVFTLPPTLPSTPPLLYPPFLTPRKLRFRYPSDLGTLLSVLPRNGESAKIRGFLRKSAVWALFADLDGRARSREHTPKARENLC